MLVNEKWLRTTDLHYRLHPHGMALSTVTVFPSTAACLFLFLHNICKYKHTKINVE
jgi:hypothetical protein